MTSAYMAPRIARGLFQPDSATVTTQKQREVFIRPGVALDAEMLGRMYHHLSARTLRLRYGAPWPQLPEAVLQSEMARILDGDRRLVTTLIGTIGTGASCSAVSVAELVQSPSDRTVAEIALLVRDDYQREGLGRTLGRMIVDIARARGVRLLRLYLQAENIAIMRLIRGMGVPYSAERSRGEIMVEIPVA
jgi:GNAT superfamily N-acetyltransferase